MRWWSIFLLFCFLAVSCSGLNFKSRFVSNKPDKPKRSLVGAGDLFIEVDKKTGDFIFVGIAPVKPPEITPSIASISHGPNHVNYYLSDCSYVAGIYVKSENFLVFVSARTTTDELKKIRDMEALRRVYWDEVFKKFKSDTYFKGTLWKQREPFQVIVLDFNLIPSDLGKREMWGKIMKEGKKIFNPVVRKILMNRFYKPDSAYELKKWEEVPALIGQQLYVGLRQVVVGAVKGFKDIDSGVTRTKLWKTIKFVKSEKFKKMWKPHPVEEVIKNTKGFVCYRQLVHISFGAPTFGLMGAMQPYYRSRSSYNVDVYPMRGDTNKVIKSLKNWFFRKHTDPRYPETYNVICIPKNYAELMEFPMAKPRTTWREILSRLNKIAESHPLGLPSVMLLFGDNANINIKGKRQWCYGSCKIFSLGSDWYQVHLEGWLIVNNNREISTRKIVFDFKQPKPPKRRF